MHPGLMHGPPISATMEHNGIRDGYLRVRNTFCCTRQDSIYVLARVPLDKLSKAGLSQPELSKAKRSKAEPIQAKQSWAKAS